MQAIKRVIREKTTGAYLNAGAWVSDFNLADVFPDTKTAFDCCYRHQIKNAELVLVMGEKPSKEYDVVLSVHL